MADTRNNGSGPGAGAQTRSPDSIQREIEATRAELAETIDAIADRISPKRAASRGAAAVKGVFGGSSNGEGRAPAAVLDASAAQSGKTDTQARQQAVREVASSRGGSAYTGSSQYTVKRTLRTDRVLVAVGVVAAVAGLVVLRRSRR